ncbi:hypothetical protein CF327_g4068 [Tilletia walkeri]|nr:hypothetical protein CF327_g4068 [Tilletia walkeri]
MVALLRLPRTGATLQELVLELGEWEPNWRVQYKVPLRSSNAPFTTLPATTPTTPASVFTPAVTRLLQPTMGRSASAPTTPAATNIIPSRAAPSSSFAPKPMSKFAAAYDPTRVIPAQNGQPRRYRPPGKDTVMDHALTVGGIISTLSTIISFLKFELWLQTTTDMRNTPGTVLLRRMETEEIWTPP